MGHEPHYKPPNAHHKPESHHGKPETYENPPHHKKDPNCVDISTWSEVKYKKVEKKHCKLDYQKITEKKQDKVCSDVTSIHCTILPYTECEMKIKTESIIPVNGSGITNQSENVKMLQKQLHTTKRSLSVQKFQNIIVKRNGK